MFPHTTNVFNLAHSIVLDELDEVKLLPKIYNIHLDFISV